MRKRIGPLYAVLTAFIFIFSFDVHARDARRDELLVDSLPATWGYSAMSQTLPDSDVWWKEFSDHVLDSLITRGVEANFNVAMAARRVEVARQAIRQAKSAYYPNIGIRGGWTKSRESGAMTSADMPATNASYFSIGADMSWQIDIFGKITAGVKQRKSQWRASRAEYAGTMVTLCGDIATAYFNLRVAQAELEVARNHVASQKRVEEITKARHEAGLASMLDVAQSQTVLYSTEATIPSLESQVESYINAIAVLTGSMPGATEESLRVPANLPDYRRLIGAGVPADLLRRRPDIAVAEQNLAASAAALGIAKKDFLPTLSLDGSIGSSAHKFGNLMKDTSFTYTVAPTLSWTVFSGFSRRAAVVSAREEMEAQIDNYNQTVLTAMQETTNAITTYYNTLKQIEALQNVVTASQKSYDLSIDLYKRGLSSFTNVADAQINLLNSANSLIVAHGQALVSLINLYEALGGGWEVPSDF